jgi:Mg2+/Co2+ transporter CorC
VVAQADGSFLADARASLEDVTGTIGPEFDVGQVADEVDTLGGYLVVQVGRVPVRGELMNGPRGFEIEVLDADPRRVKKVRIYRDKDRSSRRERARRRDGRPESEAVQGPLAAITPAPAAPRGDSAPPPADGISS